MGRCAVEGFPFSSTLGGLFQSFLAFLSLSLSIVFFSVSPCGEARCIDFPERALSHCLRAPMGVWDALPSKLPHFHGVLYAVHFRCSVLPSLFFSFQSTLPRRLFPFPSPLFCFFFFFAFIQRVLERIPFLAFLLSCSHLLSSSPPFLPSSLPPLACSCYSFFPIRHKRTSRERV